MQILNAITAFCAVHGIPKTQDPSLSPDCIAFVDSVTAFYARKEVIPERTVPVTMSQMRTIGLWAAQVFQRGITTLQQVHDLQTWTYMIVLFTTGLRGVEGATLQVRSVEFDWHDPTITTVLITSSAHSSLCG